jgi:hypothetical protein
MSQKIYTFMKHVHPICIRRIQSDRLVINHGKLGQARIKLDIHHIPHECKPDQEIDSCYNIS